MHCHSTLKVTLQNVSTDMSQIHRCISGYVDFTSPEEGKHGYSTLCAETRNFDQDRDLKYDRTGSGTKAGNRNKTGPGPRTWPSFCLGPDLDWDQDHDQEQDKDL